MLLFLMPAASQAAIALDKAAESSASISITTEKEQLKPTEARSGFFRFLNKGKEKKKYRGAWLAWSGLGLSFLGFYFTLLNPMFIGGVFVLLAFIAMIAGYFGLGKYLDNAFLWLLILTSVMLGITAFGTVFTIFG